MKTKFTFLVVAILAIVQSTGQAQSHRHNRSVPHRPSTHHSHSNHHSNNGMRNVLAVVGAGLIINSIIKAIGHHIIIVQNTFIRDQTLIIQQLLQENITGTILRTAGE